MSAPVSLTAFYPWVLPEVVGAVRVLVRDAILHAAIDFCEKTKIWRDTQAVYAVASNQLEYPLKPPSNAVVWRIMSATLADGCVLEPKSPEWCDQNYPGWRAIPPKLSGAVAITQTKPDSFFLVPPAGASQALTLDVALKPSKVATKLPYFLLEDYQQTISVGAKAMLMAMAGQKWTNLAQAALYSAVFNDHIDTANLRQSRGFGRAPFRVKAQFL